MKEVKKHTKKHASRRPVSRKDISLQTSLYTEIEKALESVRPMLALHRGDVELVSFDPDTGVVAVRLKGTCHGCPLSQLTLKAGIEEMLKQSVHGIERVEAVE